MAMEHKGYAFRWRPFAIELQPILAQALETGALQALIRFVEDNRDQLVDPYEGGPLCANWPSRLVNRDAHAYGDYALTKYYAPTEGSGVGLAWLKVAEQLSAEASRALLGAPIGPRHNLFDPGRMGSYFQTPEQVRTSLETLDRLSLPEIEGFRRLLASCRGADLGVYVTF